MIAHRAFLLLGLILAVLAEPAPAEECLEKIGQSPYGWLEDVAVNGVTAVMGNGRAMQVIDLTDPSNPVVVGEFTVPKLVRAVEVTEDLAFAGTGTVLTVVDISDPAHPTPLGTLGDLSIHGFVFAGGYLYVRGYDELVVVDVSTPAEPVELGRLEWPDDYFGSLSVQASIGYGIVDGSLRVLDLSDPTAPAEITELAFGIDRSASSLDVAGDYGYTIVYGPDPFDYSFAVVDVSDPSQPVKVTEIAASFPSRDIHVHGDLALVNGDGLEIYDISDPAYPFARGSQPIECWYNLNTVVATGDAALVTCEVTGLNIIDILDPDAPDVIATVSTPGSIVDAAAANGVLAIAAEERGLRIVDVSDPSNPVELGFGPVPLQFPVFGVDIADSIAYVGTYGGEGFKTVDVSDPANPVTLGSAAGVAGNWIVADGDRAYVVNQWDGPLFVVDVTSPAAPVVQGSLELSPGDWQWPVVINDHVFLRNNGNNQVIGVDVSDPTAPFHAISIDVEVGVGSLEATGFWLLVPDALDAATPVVRFFDMRDPALPIEIAPYVVVGSPVQEIDVVGTVAYLTNIDSPGYFDGAIEAVDVGNPRFPAFMHLIPRQGAVTRMASDKNAVYVLDHQTGFDTYALCHGPLFSDGFESGDVSEWSGATR